MATVTWKRGLKSFSDNLVFEDLVRVSLQGFVESFTREF